MLNDETSEVKRAFINAFVLIGLGFFFSVLYSIFNLLDTLIRPLIWATLIGTCLYPIKYCTTNFLKSWIEDLEEKNRSLSFGLAILPFQLMKIFSNSLSNLISLYLRWTLYFLVSVAVFVLFYENTFFLEIFIFIYQIFTVKLSERFFSLSALVLFSGLYIASLLFLIDAHRSKLSIISTIFWSYIFMYFFDFFGSLQMPLFFTFMISLLIIELLPKNIKENPESTSERYIKSSIRRSKSLSSIGEIKKKRQLFPSREIHKMPGEETQTTDNMVSKAFYFVIWCHVIVLAMTKSWTLILAFILVALAGITKVICHFSQARALNDYLKKSEHFIRNHFERQIILFREFMDLIFPYPIRNSPKLFNFIDKKVKLFLGNSLDAIVSLLIIFLGILLTILLSLFIFVQVQNETIYIISMVTNVLNGTMQNGLSSFMPSSENFHPTIKIYVNNIYEHGETFIEHKLDDLFESSSSEDAEKFKIQVLALWRNIYFSFINGSFVQNSTDQTYQKGFNSLSSDLINQISESKNKSLTDTMSMVWNSIFSFKMMNITTIASFIQSNLSIFSTMIESIYLLIKNNLFLLVSVCHGMISFLFGSSTIVLNFLISLLVFLSALFYLLSLSRERYLPMDYLIKTLAPEASKRIVNQELMMGDVPFQNTNIVVAFHNSLERAISSVFVANFKLAVFYGLYTSLTHQFFRLNLIIIPSVLAATFGAVPILSSYWAAVPGIIELVFVRKAQYMGILLFLVHLIPVQILDTAIYAQIKGAGHPYLTGLAIAGGVYWNGFEGAFFGPIVLCCILVAVNLYSVFLAPSRPR